MDPNQAPAARKTIVDTALELAAIIKNDKNFIEKELLQQGENLVGIFSDPNYTPKRFPIVNQKKVELLTRAIEDISVGVMTLRTSTIGLCYYNTEIRQYVTPHGTLPQGNVIFSVNWKNVVAFKNWRHSDGDEVTQEQINQAIYALTVMIAEFL